ncbi:hypothetical protein KPL70_008232 [Citrus sinensis]|nr:hypothetical protein KPL70_008232 [Citrus sinensis]
MLACLRQKLLSNLLKDENAIPGIDLNFRRLSCMKVLIVFDYVTCFSQLESIIGSLDWLMPVSRIIITTINKQVLRNWGVRKIYEMEALEYHHALELFSRHAFKQNHPDVGYVELSSKVMKYAQGVPLALKVLGCFLHKREKEVWESAIDKLQRILHPSILEVLKISYDSLDDKEKNIFLDVACFFQGEDVDLVMKFFNASGFYPEIGMSVLVDKSLIAIDSYNKITMHDLLQELGREIVRQESTNPENRSRLWHHQDIYEVLTYNTVSEDVNLIMKFLNASGFYPEIGISVLVDKSLIVISNNNKITMHDLLQELGRDIVSQKSNDPGNRSRLWHHEDIYEVLTYNTSLPSNISAEKLVFLEMPNSSIEQLWDGMKRLPECLGQLSSLGTLLLEKTNIERIPESIIQISVLTYLRLSYCERLQSVPKLPFLIRWLDADNCTSLQSLSGIVEDALQRIQLMAAARWKEVQEKLCF